MSAPTSGGLHHHLSATFSQMDTLLHLKKCVRLTFRVPWRRPGIPRNHSICCLRLHFCDFRESWFSFLACVHFPFSYITQKLQFLKVHAREERKPTFPEIAEMQFETANRMVSWDSRSPRWNAKCKTDTLFEMKKCVRANLGRPTSPPVGNF